MEGVNTSRLPAIGTVFQVGGIRVDREPGVRSWSRIRTCLIDNPKDDDFSRRQEIWSYQNRNRGVVKSLLKKLPNVPFRIKRNKMRQKDVETERDRIRQTISKLPNLSNSDNLLRHDSPGRNPKTRPLGMSKYSEINVRAKENMKLFHGSTPEEITETDKNNNQNEIDVAPGVAKLPKLTGRSSRTSPSKGNQKLSENSKKVSFSMNDLSTGIDQRSSSASSVSSTLSENAVENYGHTSYGVSDVTPRSVLDIFGNNNIGDSRTLETSKRKTGNSIFTVSDNHKRWLKRVVGDKELIAANDYENFARAARPYYERATDDSQPSAQIPPEKQYSRSGWNVYSQSLFTGNRQLNNFGTDKQDNKVTKLNSTKVGTRSVESRFNDFNHVKQNEADKFRRMERTHQAQTQTQSRISERIMQGMSPDRNSKSPSRTPAHAQTPTRLADRLNASKSPDRITQGQANLRNSPQRMGKSSSLEQHTDPMASPNASPSPSRFMGEYKLSKSPLPASPGRYFPIFPTDGSPMRKIGGGKNRLQKSNSKSQPLALPLQETETYVMSYI